MTRVDRTTRLRDIVERNFLTIVVVLVLIALLSGWWAFDVHVDREFEEQQRIVGQWGETSEFEHRAEVVNDTLVWDRGDVIEDRPIYYARISPELDAVYQYGFDGVDDGSMVVTTDVELVIRAVSDGTVFWEYVEPLASTESEAIGPGESHEVAFTIAIPEVLERVGRIENELGARQGLIDIQARVVSDVRGEVDGEQIDVTRESTMTLVASPETYRVRQVETVSETHQDVVFVEVPVQPSPSDQILSLAGFNGSVFLLLALLVGFYTGRFAISEEERELLTLAREREEFDDWISTGRFPAVQEYETTILVDTLVGLVDVAIDTNNRVIEDEELGVSAVLDGDYVYAYVRPDSPAYDWLVNFADTTLDEFERQSLQP